jgi:hypothetical protein
VPARPRRCHTRKEWQAPCDLPTRRVNPPLVAGAIRRPQARHPPCSRQRVSRATRTILGRCCIRKVRFEGAAARLYRRAKSATALATTALAATDPTTAAKAATAASHLSVAAAAQSPVLAAAAAVRSPPSLPHRCRYPSAITALPPPTSAPAFATAAESGPRIHPRHRALSPPDPPAPPLERPLRWARHHRARRRPIPRP